MTTLLNFLKQLVTFSSGLTYRRAILGRPFSDLLGRFVYFPIIEKSA